MDKFYKLPKFTQREVNNLNSPIPVKEVEFIVKNLPPKKSRATCLYQILPNI